MTSNSVPQARREVKRLRDTVLPFGQYRGLSFEQVRQLERGDRVVTLNTRAAFVLAPDEYLELDDGEYVETETRVLTDFDGVRYLDWLLGFLPDWYNGAPSELKDRLARYLTHPNLALDRATAFSSQARDDRGGLWPAGNHYDLLAVPNYGDGDDLAPSDFTIAETYNTGPWRWHADPTWLAVLRPGQSEYAPADADPPPAEMALASTPPTDDRDEVTDAWVDTARYPEERDWRPPAPVTTHRPKTDRSPGRVVRCHGTRTLKQYDRPEPVEVSFSAWNHGLRLAQSLDALSECRPGFADHARRKHRHEELAAEDRAPTEAPESLWDRFNALKADAKRLLGDGSGAWHPLVPPQVKKLVTDAVVAAEDRLNDLHAQELQAASAALDIEVKARDIKARMADSADPEALGFALAAKAACEHREKYNLGEQDADWAECARLGRVLCEEDGPELVADLVEA